jgi:hypothetical protein
MLNETKIDYHHRYQYETEGISVDSPLGGSFYFSDFNNEQKLYKVFTKIIIIIIIIMVVGGD